MLGLASNIGKDDLFSERNNIIQKKLSISWGLKHKYFACKLFMLECKALPSITFLRPHENSIHRLGMLKSY